jgi:hypothetical protein
MEEFTFGDVKFYSPFSCIFFLSLAVFICWSIFVSSPNFFIISTHFTVSSMSFMRIMKSRGPRTLPCGFGPGGELPIQGNSLFAIRQPAPPRRMLLLMPGAHIFLISLLCVTLSKAFANRYRYTMSKDSPLLMQAVTVSRNCRRFVVHDLPFMNPCWL